MTVITTSTAATATAYSNQRKIDRTSNGVLWTIYSQADAISAANMTLMRSTDNGASWVVPANQEILATASDNAYAPNASMFIDLDDYCHVVYRDRSSGFVYYRRGTPDANRLTYTWSAALNVTQTANSKTSNADVVAHREGTGWVAHIVQSYAGSAGATEAYAFYRKITIATNGTLTLDPTQVTLGGNYGNLNQTYPSIDFNHTGDGKTVAGGTPHLYVAWSAGATGTGYGIRFKKATYSGGTWTWGTEREIDSTRYNPGSANWLSLLFDGTRCIIGGYLAGTTTDVVLYERDAADTATATRVLVSNAGTASANYHRWGSLTYDASGNAYFFASNGDNRVFYRIWERASTTYGPTQTIDSSAGTSPYITSKRGYSGGRVEFIYTDGTASPYNVKYSYVGDSPDLYPSPIATSTAATATAYPSQRKLDRTSNGVLWAVYADAIGGGYPFRSTYSLDNGATWSTPDIIANGSATMGSSYIANVSFFIDQDDYAHVVFKDNGDGYIYYRRGTPNAGRTAWTWSAATLINNGTTMDYPDVVAHREGTGWVAHIVWSYMTSSSFDRVYYNRVLINSSGTPTLGTQVQLSADSYGVAVHKYPSIDFNHTGDGKTVAGGTPHLYVAWSAGTSGAGKGIRFRKATYSTGAWTWNTEVEIDSTRYVSVASGSPAWLNCMFDGTRVVITGMLVDSGSVVRDIVAYDRDVADTLTTPWMILDSQTTDSANRLWSGASTYDSDGNLYFFGRPEANAGLRDVRYRRWVRSTNIFESAVIVSSGSSVGEPYVSVKRGYSNRRVEFIYTDGTASPYVVTFDKIVLNKAPVVTLANITTIDPRVANDITWSFSDADNDTQASAEVSIRTTGGAWSTLSGTPKGNYKAIQMAFNPSVYYQLNETSGTTAVASVGANGTYASGTVGGGTSPVPGDAAPNGGYVVRPNWTQTQAMTINCWFKCDPGELDDSISYRSLWGFGPNNWDARFNTKRSVTFHAYAADGSWYNWGLTTTFDMDDGKWHMLTLVWDGTAGNWKSYLDGVYNSGQAFPPQMPSMNGGNFWIGASGGQRVWAGEYAQFSVVPAALTGQNVTDLYNSAKTAFALTIPANTLTDETDYEVRVRVSDGKEWSSYDTKTFRADSWTYFPEVTSSSNVSTISTASLDRTTDYEVQVRAYDGYDYSPWDSATMLFTKHYVYVNGAWMPMVKKEYWVRDWKVGRSSKF